MKNNQNLRQNGLILYTPTGKDEIHKPYKNRVLGNIKIPFAENWTRFNSDGERQRKKSDDTQACVSFSATNVLENIFNFYQFLVYSKKANKEQSEIYDWIKLLGFFENGKANVSDRFIAKTSGTTREGNTQKEVWNAIRHYGLIPEKEYPFVESWDEYYQEISKKLIYRGEEFADKIEVNYEFVEPSNYPSALGYSPLQTAVYAWGDAVGGIYTRMDGIPLNHATMIDFSKFGEWYSVFDSYEPHSKKAAWDFNFGWGVLPTIHLRRNYFRKLFSFFIK